MQILEHIPIELDVLFHKGCGGRIETTCQMAMPLSYCLKCGRDSFPSYEVIGVKYKRVGVL